MTENYSKYVFVYFINVFVNFIDFNLIKKSTF